MNILLVLGKNAAGMSFRSSWKANVIAGSQKPFAVRFALFLFLLRWSGLRRGWI